jgi:hypothetical protein
MKNLQKMGGFAALCEALIYISIFTLYGSILATPSNLSAAQKLAFLSDNQHILFFANLLGYVVFGLLLSILVLALHERMKNTANTLARLASIFGVLWVGLVIISGMLANIGLNAILKLSLTEPEQTRALWLSVTTMTEALGGGNEIVGGLWVLLISCAGLKAKALPRTLNYLGVFVGTIGISTSYPAAILTEIFGISQIVWFGFLSVAMLRSHQDSA